MTKKVKNITFKTIEEYYAFYAPDDLKQDSKGSKYYRIGEEVAKMACDRVVNKLSKEQQNGVRVTD